MKKTFREWRKEKGYRTGFVADKLGITPANYCSKENGTRHFNVDEVDILLKLFGIELSQVKLV